MPYTLKELKQSELWQDMNDADEREYELLLNQAITNVNVSGSYYQNVDPT